jgi:hypothetical protein
MTGPAVGKKSWFMTRAEVAPYSAKSYHSIMVPTVLAATTGRVSTGRTSPGRAPPALPCPRSCSLPFTRLMPHGLT